MAPVTDRGWKAFKTRFSGDPERDPGLVGITFIDVLFAIVVGKTLEPLAVWDQLSLTAYGHLIVAFVLTVTSWVGYHTSPNSPKYVIRFPNLPLLQFLVDIALVVVYWMTASYVEGTYTTFGRDIERAPSAQPEALLVFISFVLYFLWDRIGLAMGRDDHRYKAIARRDAGPRHRVTEAFLGLSAIIALFSYTCTRETERVIFLIDLALIALLVLYRFAKQYVRQESDERSPSVEDHLRDARDAIDEALRLELSARDKKRTPSKPPDPST